MKNKKLIIFITIVSLIATTAFVVPIMSYGASKYHDYKPDKKGKTTTSAVMRNGSSTSKKKICTVPKGGALTIYGYDEVPGYNWYKVKYGSKTGYIRRDLIKVTSTTSSSSSSSSKYNNYSPDKKGKTTASVNMRKGSSTSYGKVCTVPKGGALTIYGYDEVPGYNWYKVKYSSKTGYIRRDFIKVTGNVKKESSITGSGITYPKTLNEGKGFSIKGKLTSVYNIAEVKVGIMKKSTNKFYASYTATAKPNATSYDISKLNAKVPFSKAKPGTYYYTVWAKDVNGVEFTVSKKSFTVKKKASASASTLNIKNETKPVKLEIGQGFVVRGIVSSNYNLDNVTVKVKDANGRVMKGCDESANPTGKSYDINKLNKGVKISALNSGDYNYEVVGKDDSGKSKTLVDQDFVINSTQTSSQGKILDYNVSKFKKIGKQPYSGPCGLYAMAYGRLVIDGDFKINSKYSSVCEQLQSEYGQGSNLAHWNEAGAHSVWTTSAKVAYQNVLKEINEGRPCIIPITTTRNTNHFVTVIGYKKGTTASNVNLSRLVILDPGYGTQYSGNPYNYIDKASGDARYISFK